MKKMKGMAAPALPDCGGLPWDEPSGIFQQSYSLLSMNTCWCFRACKNPQPKGSEPHKAVIGYTIGYPLKDTPGLSFNILIKLMAVESLLFTPFIAAHGGLLFKI
ncbi:H(+)-exporting diphosphatase [Forsythia ovata]|uniref:H(+)-exporting diphosphatase n=1 Tax=Forsythia ovata TaxID=205694 RepID=A0ABD1RJX8_9LAMI